MPRERVIVPLVQAWTTSPWISLDTAGDPAAVLGRVRAAVRPRRRARARRREPQTLRARMDWFLRMYRVIAGFGLLGGISSALIAAIGLYSVAVHTDRSRDRAITAMISTRRPCLAD